MTSLLLVATITTVVLLFSTPVLSKHHSPPKTRPQKSVRVELKNFLELVGQDKYVFMYVYSSTCPHCKKLATVFDTLFDFYMDSHAIRDDILIARMDGSANKYLCDQLQVADYPQIFLFRPNDFRYPLEYSFTTDFPTMKAYLQTFPYYKRSAQEERASAMNKIVRANRLHNLRLKVRRQILRRQRQERNSPKVLQKRIAEDITELRHIQASLGTGGHH